ncbi:MAG: protein kinase [Deltaproteobacteria bacterium]|nr:protein kinase [Deltaproteobacteria bacterium]
MRETASAGDQLRRRAERRVGAVLNEKWQLDRLLGVGGMAAVYAATHRNGKRVAVKVLHPERALNESIRRRFLREGYAANKVDHPGAVSVLDDAVAKDGSVFLVMDLLEGETLQARIERVGPLPVEAVLPVVHCLLDVLAAAHDKGIVHRDLKPENVFVTDADVVKVLDFGIARLREDAGRTGATGADTSLGTPAFMPPEQARGRWNQVDGRSDLWAVGAIMFTLLTGRYVHQAATLNEHLLAAMTEPAPALGVVAPEVPAQVASIVDRALAFEKDARWPDARAMQQAVADAYEALVGTPLPEPGEHSSRGLARPPASRPRSASAPVLSASGDASRSTTAGGAHELGGIPARARRRSYLLAAALLVAVAVGAAWLVPRGAGRDRTAPPAAAGPEAGSASAPASLATAQASQGATAPDAGLAVRLPPEPVATGGPSPPGSTAAGARAAASQASAATAAAPPRQPGVSAPATARSATQPATSAGPSGGARAPRPAEASSRPVDPLGPETQW